jgi:hypothetical protein
MKFLPHHATAQHAIAEIPIRVYWRAFAVKVSEPHVRSLNSNDSQLSTASSTAILSQSEFQDLAVADRLGPNFMVQCTVQRWCNQCALPARHAAPQLQSSGLNGCWSEIPSCPSKSLRVSDELAAPLTTTPRMGEKRREFLDFKNLSSFLGFSRLFSSPLAFSCLSFQLLHSLV